MDQVYDCIVVGAGPGGLSASLFLARYLHKTVTFHNNSPRNEYAHGVHGFLGHHGVSPATLLAKGRDEVMDHGGLIVEACVTEARKISDDHFEVTIGADGRTFASRRLLLATGLRDLTPDCPGFRDFYGVTVHHCPDCDGYESRNQRIAVLGSGTKTVGFALGLLTWTDKITLITNGNAEDVSIAEREFLSTFAIQTLDNKIAALEGDKDPKKLSRVVFADADPLECDALFFNLGTELSSDLHNMLGCQLDEESKLIWVDHSQQTSVKGVYAVGDITPNSQLAVVAAAEGAIAAIQIHQSLIPSTRKMSAWF
jgi:thioredoxin reductase